MTKAQEIADIIIGEMFAPHELPLDDKLAGLYLAIANKVLAALPQSPADLHALIDWTYLYATEGEAWPDPATISDLLIELAKRAPTQADAALFKEGYTLKGMLSLTRPDREGQ